MKSIDFSFTITESPEPLLKEKQALIKVKYFGVSLDDVRLHNLGVPFAQLGTEFSGVIQKLGPLNDTSGFQIGDRVMGFISQGGSMAANVACYTNLLVKIPIGLTDAEAATIPDMWVNAIQLLKNDGEFAKRNRIAIFNAMSPIGQAMVQLAQLVGCRRVHCVANSEEASLQLAKHLTFRTALTDEVIVHHASNGISKVLRNIAAYDPRGLEAVVNLGDETVIVPEMMRPQGRIVISSNHSSLYNSEKGVNWDLIATKSIKIHGRNIRGRDPITYAASCDFLAEHVIPKLVQRRLHIEIGSQFSWKQLKKAFDYVNDNPETLGKVVCYIE